MYYVIRLILYPISILPFWCLHRLSDVFCFLIFNVFQYRRQITTTNLAKSFPEKSKKEIVAIRRKFERHFCDLILETITTLSIGEKRLKRHVTFKNIELFEKYYREKKSLILVLGHMGNWELIGAAFATLPVHKLYVIYRPLKSQVFNRLIRFMRMRLGNGLYAMKDTVKNL